MTEGNKLVPILDIPAYDPGMHFKEIAKVLANLLKNAEPPQITIGIFGGYGSGKTTLMRAIEKELGDEQITVRFNAWRYDHEDHLFLPFLAALVRNEKIIEDAPTVVKKCSSALKGIIRGLSIKSVIEFSVKDALEAEKEFLKGDVEKILCGYTDVYNELEKIPFEKGGEGIQERIVIFVDDLDRCVPDKAFALLESLKSFMDIEGFIFVLGLDPRAVETYLLEKYKQGFCVTPEEYLEKMIQIPIHLPRPTKDDVVREIGRLANWAKAVLEEAGDLKKFLPCNIRQVKRILNIHQAIMAADESPKSNKVDEKKQNINSKVLLGLLIIELRWPLAYWALYSFLDVFEDIFNYCYNAAKDTEGSIPVIMKNNPKAMAELKDEEFARIYEIVLESLHDSIEEARPYLERMGWPIYIESKLKREDEDFENSVMEKAKPLGYRIEIQPELKSETKND